MNQFTAYTSTANYSGPHDFVRALSSSHRRCVSGHTAPRAFSGPKTDSKAPPPSSSRPVRGQSAPLAKQPLASYSWPQSRPDVIQWLEDAIQYAVQRLDKAPFLELVHPRRQNTQCSLYPVTEAVVDSPQLWKGIAEHLNNGQPEVVILLHQLPPVEEDRKSNPTGRWASPDDKMFTGIASHEALNQSRLKYCSMLLKNGIAEGVLAGQVGDCCEGEGTVQNQILPFTRQQHSQLNWDTQSDDSGEQLVDFWGLVVQSKITSDAEGAYVLKTVRNPNPVGCQCTHYSLMRVCQGDLVKTHMSSAWLLNR